MMYARDPSPRLKTGSVQDDADDALEEN